MSNPYARKLTPEQVAEIRQSTESQPTLAKKFGVAKSLIFQIKSGKIWKEKKVIVNENLLEVELRKLFGRVK